MALQTDQRRRLEAVRLASALARLGVDPAEVVDSTSPIGPAVIAGRDGWVVAVEHEHHALAVAHLWAESNGIVRLNVVVGEQPGLVARRARHFARKTTIWTYVDNLLVTQAPSPHEPNQVVAAKHERFASLIADCGVDVVREHGVLSGEVLGLEVCRVVDDASDPDGVRLEIGVGVHDRETFRLVHGAVATGEQLMDVARTVAGIRNDPAAQHPLARLALERRLRSRLLASPHLVDASRLAAAEPPVVRTNVKDSVPCVAIGERANGSPLVVVCTAIADLNVVAFGADARDRLSTDAELVVTSLPGNVTPSIRRLGEMLQRPATFVELEAHGD